MKKQLLIVLMIGAAAIASCTKRTGPESASAPPPPGTGEPLVENDGDSALEALQSALIAAAGSDRVFFALDADALSSEARNTLQGQASWLRQHPNVGFSVEGHADERGTREYNLALGDRRARAAAEFLILQGVAPSRITTISYGKERPDALGSDENSYARNRRAVSIVIRLNGN